jgi:hypothetical protein
MEFSLPEFGLSSGPAFIQCPLHQGLSGRVLTPCPELSVIHHVFSEPSVAEACSPNSPPSPASPPSPSCRADPWNTLLLAWSPSVSFKQPQEVQSEMVKCKISDCQTVLLGHLLSLWSLSFPFLSLPPLPSSLMPFFSF